MHISTPMPSNTVSTRAAFQENMSKLFRRRSHVQLVDPQITTLLTQPEIRLAYALGAHPSARPDLVSVGSVVAVRDASIGYGVDDMETAGAVLSRQALRQHAHARPPGAIGRVLGIRPQRA